MPFLIIIIAFIIALLIKYNSPKSKGKRGEKTVSTWIGETIPNKQYVINDIYLKDQNGRTCQIDHIVINENGIFVIETKNYSGRIYGKEDHQYWTQTFKSRNRQAKKYKFYNPIKQNETHIYMLRKTIGTKLPIKSIVVFTQGNTNYIESKNVYTLSQMKSEIQKAQGIAITKAEMNALYNTITTLKIKNQNIEQEHIKNINQQQAQIEANICPRCGGKLIERKGKFGTFYGCYNYPNCKFKKK